MTPPKDHALACTGLSEDVRAMLADALASVEGDLGQHAYTRLHHAHEDVVERCREDETETAILVGMIAEMEDAADDVVVW